MINSPVADVATETAPVPDVSPPHKPSRNRRTRPVRLATTIRVTIITAILFAVGLVWIYPFFWMVLSSIKSSGEIYNGLQIFPKVIRLDNYVRAWTEGNIGRYFVNTVFITVGSIIISVGTTALIGYVLGRYQFPGKKAIIGLFAGAVFLPEGYTIIPIFDLINKMHLSGSLWGVTLAEAGGAHIIAVLLFAGYFRQLPHELEEAARMDGAGFLRIFAQIYLPLAKPVVATATILQFLHSWNSFLLPLVLTLPRPELRTLAVGIYSFQGDNTNDWGAMTAASTIALVPVIIVFLLLQRHFVESMAGAVKG